MRCMETFECLGIFVSEPVRRHLKTFCLVERQARELLRRLATLFPSSRGRLGATAVLVRASEWRRGLNHQSMPHEILLGSLACRLGLGGRARLFNSRLETDRTLGQRAVKIRWQLSVFVQNMRG
jgi:hypothetical protein